jgi:hypothetical protein
MTDIYSTSFLAKVVEQLNRPSSFLLDTYFPQIVVSDTEEINFDLVTGARRLAPLVLPVVEGEVMQEQGVSAKTIKPAYVKPKTPLAPSGALSRMAGERIGGNMSAMDRQIARVAKTIEDHVRSITRRKEWMASSALRTGAITLSGDKYPTQAISYSRNAALTVTLSGATAWGATDVEPLQNLRTWAGLVLLHGGVGALEVTMDVSAWNLFFASADVQAQLNYRRDVAARFNSMTNVTEGGVYQGSIGNMNFYTYAGWYVDDAGSTQPMLPEYSVIMGGPGIEGIQAHGAIQDDAAGLVGMEYFAKSWVPQDPAVRQVLTQSAPLVVPCNVNGSLCATVA